MKAKPQRPEFDFRKIKYTKKQETEIKKKKKKKKKEEKKKKKINKRAGPIER